MKKYFYILPLLIFCCTSGAYSQAASKSSAPSSTVILQEANKLLQGAGEIMDKKPKEALSVIDKALEISISQKDENGKALCYKALGDLYFKQKEYQLAATNYEKAYNIYSFLKNEDSVQELNKKLGDANNMLGKDNRAIDYYNNFKSSAKKRKNKNEEIEAELDIAQVERKQKKFSSSISRYEKVKKIEEEQNNVAGNINVNNQMASTYLEQNQTDEAIVLLEESKELAKQTNNEKVLEDTYDNLSNAYKDNNDFENAINTRKEALELEEKQGDVSGISRQKLELGKILVDNEEEDDAIAYLQSTIASSTETGKLEEESTANKVLAQAYSNKKEYDKALKAYKNYVRLKDSIYKQKEEKLKASVELTKELIDREKKIDLMVKDQELNEKELSLLRANKASEKERLKRQQAIIIGLVLGILILLITSLIVVKNIRQKKRANQLLALKSLRSQMNPHFIFNSLNSVNSFIAKSDERSANKYLSDFARLMRAVMENSNYDFVPLKSELNILELYIGLEHFRFQDKFDYSFVVSPDIPIESIEIPPMLIQPYIENAVWHGLRYKETLGTLKVTISKKENLLRVVVEDDGIGRAKSKLLKTRNQKENNSTGMKNIETRLAILNEINKTKMTVSIRDKNSNSQGSDSGTVVEILIPYQESEQ